MSLKEAHGRFIEEHGNVAGFSKFAELRPKQVILFQSLPHNVCLCEVHENLRLKLLALSRIDPNIKVQFRDFIGRVVCDQDRQDCMLGDCADCHDLKKVEEMRPSCHSTVTYKQWTKTREEDLYLARLNVTYRCFLII